MIGHARQLCWTIPSYLVGDRPIIQYDCPMCAAFIIRLPTAISESASMLRSRSTLLYTISPRITSDRCLISGLSLPESRPGAGSVNSSTRARVHFSTSFDAASMMRWIFGRAWSSRSRAYGIVSLVQTRPNFTGMSASSTIAASSPESPKPS